MLNLLPLPIIWLFFYLIGRFFSGRSLESRRNTISAISLLLLLFACGATTWFFYLSLSLGIILAGSSLRGIKNPKTHKMVFGFYVCSIAVMILVFLEWRIYFQKEFVYLPSLSYLGFRGIAFLTSVYKRRDVSTSSGLMQMLFFPMLFTGPISRVENFEEEKEDFSEVLRRLMLGLSMLILGHVSSDYVINRVIDHYNAGIHWSKFWIGAVANSFELYFTFAGYTHLVIGLGLLVGFKLPENFNMPYFSTSITEFWRRWHMSLSYWVRDYMYIPLGGNRKGMTRKCFHLLLCMGVIGIWHGLKWHYFLWGVYHGLLLCIESLMTNFGFSPLEKIFPRINKQIKIVITFILVTFGWLIFKYPIPKFLLHIKGMFAC